MTLYELEQTCMYNYTHVYKLLQQTHSKKYAQDSYNAWSKLYKDNVMYYGGHLSVRNSNYPLQLLCEKLSTSVCGMIITVAFLHPDRHSEILTCIDESA